MADRRSSPYIHVTWLTKLLAGEDHCEWRSWFRAHYRWDKLTSDFDLAQWIVDHSKMVHTRAEVMRHDGFEVSIESQNDFRVKGRSGVTLAGKPDIVAVRNGVATVVDCKAGQQRHSDRIQVLIYMLVLPHARSALQGLRIDGEIYYSTGSVTVPAAELTDNFKARFRELMLAVGGDSPLAKAPSYNECHFCDISSDDCPERVEEPLRTVVTDLF